MVLIPIAFLIGAFVFLHLRGFRDGAFSDPLLFLTGISLLAYIITQPKRTMVPVAIVICSVLMLLVVPMARTPSTDTMGLREIRTGADAYNVENFDKAIAAYSDAIQINPRSLDALYGRGLAHIRLEAFEKAIADFNKAIEIDATFVDAYRARGAAYFESGDDDNAIQDFTEAIRLDSTDFEAFHNRGVAYHFQGDQTKALADLETCKELGGRVSEELLVDVRQALDDENDSSD